VADVQKTVTLIHPDRPDETWTVPESMVEHSTNGTGWKSATKAEIKAATDATTEKG
jgi:hypothetical protein